MAKKFMKGCEAIAEAAVRSGCRFFAGYPITPQNEIPEYFARRMPLEINGLWLHWCFFFSFKGIHSCSQDAGTQSKGSIETLAWHLHAQYRYFLHQWGLSVSLWRATYSLCNSLSCLGTPMWLFWPTTQLYVTQSHIESILGDKRWPVGILFPPLFGDFL